MNDLSFLELEDLIREALAGAQGRTAVERADARRKATIDWAMARTFNRVPRAVFEKRYDANYPGVN